MIYYKFSFFKNLSVQDKINFKAEYMCLRRKENICFLDYLFQSQRLFFYYKKKIILN